jgi:hypothetical protein
MHSLFELEIQIAIGHLNGDGNHDRVAGHAKKIRTVVHVNVGVNDAHGNQLFEILESRRRALNAEIAVQPIEFIHTGGLGAKRHRTGRPVLIQEATRFRGHAHDFGQTQAHSGDVSPRVLFARVIRHVVFAGACSVGSTNSISMFSPMPSRCR